MLARRQRLSRKSIDYLFKKGQRLTNNYFGAKYLPSIKKYNRFCIVVSLKIAPKAVIRNLLRRRIAEALQLGQKTLKQTYDLILIAKAPLLNLPYDQLSKVVGALLKNLKPTHEKK